MFCSWFLFSSACSIHFKLGFTFTNFFIYYFILCGCICWSSWLVFIFFFVGDRPKEVILASGYFHFAGFPMCLITFFIINSSLHSSHGFCIVSFFLSFCWVWYFVWWSRKPCFWSLNPHWGFLVFWPLFFWNVKQKGTRKRLQNLIFRFQLSSPFLVLLAEIRVTCWIFQFCKGIVMFLFP